MNGNYARCEHLLKETFEKANMTLNLLKNSDYYEDTLNLISSYINFLKIECKHEVVTKLKPHLSYNLVFLSKASKAFNSIRAFSDAID